MQSTGMSSEVRERMLEIIDQVAGGDLSPPCDAEDEPSEGSPPHKRTKVT